MLKGSGSTGENIKSLKRSGKSESEAVSLTLQRQSLDQRMDRVRSAVTKALQPPKKKGKGDDHSCGGCSPCGIGDSPYLYCKEVFDTYAIVEQGDKLWKVPFTDDGKDVTVGTKVAVKQTYTPTGD